MNIDFQILGANEENDELMDVLLVAAKKDIINDYLSVLLEAGLNPVIIDIDAFALENMYQTNYPTKMGEIVGIVDIGASVMNIGFYKGCVQGRQFHHRGNAEASPRRLRGSRGPQGGQ